MLDPFTTHHAMLVDDIGDGHVGIRSMKFKESFDEDSIYGNDDSTNDDN